MSKKEREFPFYVNNSGKLYYNACYPNNPRHAFNLSNRESFRKHVICQLGNYGSDVYPLVRSPKSVCDYAHRLYQCMEVSIDKMAHLFGSFSMMKFLSDEDDGILVLEPKAVIMDEKNRIIKIIKPDVILKNSRNCIVEVQGGPKMKKRKINEISKYCSMIDNVELCIAFPDYVHENVIKKNLNRITGAENKRAFQYNSLSFAPFLRGGTTPAVVEVEL